jgi:hypothetical protein
VRQELANGEAQVRGTVMIDSDPLYQIDLGDGAVGYFDENNYELRYVDDSQPAGTLSEVARRRLQIHPADYVDSSTAERDRSTPHRTHRRWSPAPSSQ